MENNLKWIVYCTTCTENKKIYIGVHQTNPNYYDQYLGCGCYSNNAASYERSKTRFQKAVKKYGPKKFIRNTIATFDNEDDAYALEADIVNEEFLKRSDVYNLALGGKCGGYILQSIPCYIYDENGIFITEYNSYNEAAKALSRNLRSIQRAIKDKYKCAGYYITDIKYDKLDLSKMHKYEGPNKIPCFQYDINGKYECCYESISDAAKILHGDRTNIGRAIQLGIPYKNRYFSDIFNLEYSVSKSERINSREVHQYDLEGNYIASYKNQEQAKKAVHTTASIYQAIKLGQLCKGYQWSFEKLNKIAPVKPKKGRARKIGKYDKNWNLVKEYNSLAECKRENGAAMEYVLRGRNEFSKGFRYKYLS